MPRQKSDQGPPASSLRLRRAFEQLLMATATDPQFPPPNLVPIVRGFILGMLIAHRDNGVEIPPGPLSSLIEALEALQRGHNSPLFVPARVKQRGPPGRHPLEETCIDVAVSYHLSVDSGQIDDPHPTRTINEAFGGQDKMAGGLDARTIQKWITERRSRSEPLPGQCADVMLRLAGHVYSTRFSRKARADRANVNSI